MANPDGGNNDISAPTDATADPPNVQAPTSPLNDNVIVAPQTTPGNEGNVLSDLAKRYVSQFTTTIETLKKRAFEVKDDFDKGQTPVQLYLVQAKQVVTDPTTRQQIIEVFADDSPVPESAGSQGSFQFILETYAWTTICLIAASVGGLLGGYILSPLIGLVCSTLTTIVIAYMALPYYEWISFNTPQPDDTRAKMHLLVASFLIGLCNGHNLSSTYLYSITPPGFLLALSIALVAEFIGPKVASSRRIYIAASIGPAVVVYLLLGLVTGSLGLAYILFTLVGACVATLSLLHTLYTLRQGQVNAFLTQLVFIAAIITAKAILTFMLGTSAEKYAAYKQAQQQPVN